MSIFDGSEHMEFECFHDSHIALVDTYNGTEVVPCDLLGLDDCPDTDTLQEYCEGAIVDPEPAIVTGYVWRLSAPGYLDCTAWSYAETEREAEQDAAEMHED